MQGRSKFDQKYSVGGKLLKCVTWIWNEENDRSPRTETGNILVCSAE